jgi:thioesterase domain-containing protein
MTTPELLRLLRSQNIRVRANGERLCVDAPEGVLTAELQAELAARKSEILGLLGTTVTRYSSLVPIQRSGSRPVFYGVPGPDGDVFCYTRLAGALGPDQPFYAFEFPGVEGDRPPETRIEALAEGFLRDLRAFQPHGPYMIGGFCLGGIVAFELARQLRAQGRDVALLALFQSPSPNGLTPWHRAIDAMRWRCLAAVRRAHTLSGQSWSERLAFVRSRVVRRAPTAGNGLSGEPGHDRREQHKARVLRATIEAALAYARRPPMYDGQVVLFLGSRELMRKAHGRPLDWARLAGKLRVAIGPDGCTDYLMMLRDQRWVRSLADLLRPYLANPSGQPTAPGATGTVGDPLRCPPILASLLSIFEAPLLGAVKESLGRLTLL